MAVIIPVLKFSLVIACFLVMASGVCAKRRVGDSEDWYPHGAHSYKIFSNNVGFKQADATCKLEPEGQLVTLKSQDEALFVQNLLLVYNKNSQSKLLRKQNIWLGARYQKSSSSWVWVDQSPVSQEALSMFSGLNITEPIMFPLARKHKDYCLHLRLPTRTLTAEYCHQKAYPFVCQRPSCLLNFPGVVVTTPTTLDTNPLTENYLSNQRLIWSIIAPVGFVPTINFTKFDVEPGYDYFWVLDGPQVESRKLVQPMSGWESDQTYTPRPLTLTANGRYLTVMFTSDDGTNGRGVATDVTFVAGKNNNELCVHSTCSTTCEKCLSYRGGPVLTHGVVVPIYWNSNTAYITQLDNFYADIFTSAWFGNFAQYDVLPGTRGTSYTGAFAPGKYTDAEVRDQIISLINSNAIAAPTGQTYYPVHLPLGVSIVEEYDDGYRQVVSCLLWCAFHGTFVLNGVNVQYGIIPDLSVGVCRRCGQNSQVVDNVFSVSSHELIETLTDPAIGLLDGYKAWYNDQLGEIGDYCWDKDTNITAANNRVYVVQREWSNCAQACV